MSRGTLCSLMCLGAGVQLTPDSMYQIYIKSDTKHRGCRVWVGLVQTWVDYS